jgi:hypothetical protein
VAVLIVNLNTTTVAFNLNTLNPRRQFKPWPVALRRGGMFDLTANQLASTLLEAQQLIGASPDALFFLNRKTIGLLDTVTGEAVNPAVPPTASVPTQEIPVARLLTDVEVDQGFVLPADAVGADLIDASTLRVTAAPEPEVPAVIAAAEVLPETDSTAKSLVPSMSWSLEELQQHAAILGLSVEPELSKSALLRRIKAAVK